MTGTCRHPAHSGRFYPGEPDVLATTVDRLLRAAAEPPCDDRRVRALIAPHAGYQFSGPIAASAYRSLDDGGDVRRVVILAPNHTVPLAGMAVTGVDQWLTPLGPVDVDDDLRRLILRAPGVVVDDVPHATEHAAEVQLPFLQRRLAPGFTVLPVVVGRVAADDVAAALERLWDEPGAFVVVSSDLSHYLDHETARRIDRTTAAAIVAVDPDAIAPDRACGAYPIRGLLTLVRRRELLVELLDLRTSGDTSGSTHSVVGYGAFRVTASNGRRTRDEEADRP